MYNNCILFITYYVLCVTSYILYIVWYILHIEPTEPEAPPAEGNLRVGGQSASNQPMQDGNWLANVRAFPALSCTIPFYPALSCLGAFRQLLGPLWRAWKTSWRALGLLLGTLLGAWMAFWVLLRGTWRLLGTLPQ